MMVCEVKDLNELIKKSGGSEIAEQDTVRVLSDGGVFA